MNQTQLRAARRDYEQWQRRYALHLLRAVLSYNGAHLFACRREE